jgi:putative transposase
MSKSKSSKVPHEARPEICGPAHVVLRIRRGLPGLRTPRAYRVLEGAFRRGKKKDGFALLEFSVLEDHLHLVVETQDRESLARGMQGLMIRIAKQLNRFWHRRRGGVFAERYFALAVEKRAQLWRTIRYVLNNARKHGQWLLSDQPDPFSSGRWFRRWTRAERMRVPLRSPPVERASTFEAFLTLTIDLDDRPGPRRHEWSDALDSAALLPV